MFQTSLSLTRLSLSTVPRGNFQKRHITLDLKKARAADGLVVTVFGATGFLGRYVVNRLARSGAQIIVPFRGEEKSYDQLKPMGDVGQIVPIRYTIRDEDLIKKSVSHSNIVINLLGERWNTRNFTLEEVNIEAARLIAKASKEAGVERFIHVSTVNADVNSNSHWARTKALGENAIKEIIPESTIIRSTPVYGPEDRLLNRLAYLSRWTPVLPLLFNPKNQIQPIYARDFASAIIAVLGEDSSFGKVYEIGGSELFTWDQLVKDIVFDYTKDEKMIAPIPHQLAKPLARVFEQFRRPLYTLDEVEFYQKDAVVSNGALNLNDLNVKPVSIHDHALNILRQYRRPVSYDAL